MDYVTAILIGFWATLSEMSVYLLFGFGVAGLLSVLISPNLVRTHLGGKNIWPITKASLFGIPLPLCSCGVLPVTTSLRKHGASKGASISFLLSTPQTGVDSIAVTYSLLGPLFAIIRPVTTFITGVLGGMLVELIDPTKNDDQPKCEDECCTKQEKKSKIVAAFQYGFISLPRDIAKAMLAGIVIAAILSAIIPGDFFAEKLGRGIVPMLVMMVLGIPVYVCSTASVPIAVALIAKGLTPGAALVFLMTGPATNAASFAIIWKLFGTKTALIYLFTVAFCSIGFGLMLDYLAFDVGLEVVSHPMGMMPPLVKNISAVILLSILIYGAITKKTKAAKVDNQ